MINRIQDWWSGLAMNNRVILVASAVGGLIALIGFITWAGTPEYVPLYTNLTAQDTSQISDKLREWNVPFRLQAQGTAIDVPQPMHDELLVKLSTIIQPQNGAEAGWGNDKDLTTQNPMISQPMEEEQLRRKHQDDLARVLSRIDSIQSARVLYTPADATPYAADSDKHDATAAVMVVPKQGQNISDENVQAMLHLTQMAFKNLTVANITIADSHGTELYSGAQAGRFGEGAAAKMQRSEEMAMKNSLQAEFNQIYPNKISFIVHIEKSFDHKTTREVRHADGPISSRQVATETYNGNSGDAANVAAGAQANKVGAAPPGAPGIPSYAGGSSENGGKYAREDKTEAHDNDITEVTREDAPGQISKLTIAAFVDKSVPADEIPKIKNHLTTFIAAASTDATQTRLVTVDQVAFEVPKPEADTHQGETVTRALSLLVPLVLMLVCFLLLARALRHPVRFAPDANRLALAGAGGSMALSGAGAPLMLNADGTPVPGQTVGSDGTSPDNSIIGVLTGDTGPKTYDVISEQFDAHLESILHMARNKPDMVSALLKGWLSEDD